MGSKMNGEAEAIRQKSREISQFASDTDMGALRIHAYLDNMPSEQTWDDDNHRQFLDRFADLRDRVRQATQDMQILSTEMNAIAGRYEF